MALVKNFERLAMDRYSVHQPAQCTYSVFSGLDGKRYFQLDTYGSESRQLPGKKSQTIQMDEQAAKQLVDIIKSSLIR